MTTNPINEAKLRGDTVEIDLWYPGIPGNVQFIEVGLMDVRASDSIRVSFSHARNGYVIEQARRFAWNVGDTECGRDWQEVAFVEAWARAETEDEQEARLGTT